MMAAHSTPPKMTKEKQDDRVGVVSLSKNNRSSDPIPSTAVKQDTGYESGLTKSQTAELLAEVHTHQQCSQLTLPNPMTGWAIEHVRASDLISKCRAAMSTPRVRLFLLPLGDTNVAAGVSRIPGPLLHADASVQYYDDPVSAP